MSGDTILRWRHAKAAGGLGIALESRRGVCQIPLHPLKFAKCISHLGAAVKCKSSIRLEFSVPSVAEG